MDKSQAGIENWVKKYIQSVLDTGDGPIPVDVEWTDLGVDSVELVIMAGVIEEDFDIPVDPQILIEYPTIETFAAHLSSALKQRA